jgi:hypothetical protein
MTKYKSPGISMNSAAKMTLEQAEKTNQCTNFVAKFEI